MIKSINEFKSFLSILNEVRIPAGLFKVTGNFMLPDQEGWDTVFGKDDIIEIKPQERQILKWNKDINKWTIKNVDWIKFMMPDVYTNFKKNVVKIDPDVKLNIPGVNKPKNPVEFTTTVRAFPRRVAEFDLEDGDRIKVTLLERFNIPLNTY